MPLWLTFCSLASVPSSVLRTCAAPKCNKIFYKWRNFVIFLVNNFAFLCQSTKNRYDSYRLMGHGMPWGTWSSRVSCPANSYICGIKTRVECQRGRVDDTALNDAIFYCCKLRRKIWYAECFLCFLFEIFKAHLKCIRKDSSSLLALGSSFKTSAHLDW